MVKKIIPKAKLTNGPAIATEKAPIGVLDSRSIEATPPKRKRVIEFTVMPWERATKLWPNSCNNTEPKSNKAITKPNNHPNQGERPCKIPPLISLALARVTNPKIKNQEESR